MTKLEKLYRTINNLEELSIVLPEDVLLQTAELEEKIIRKDILPVLTAQIAPTLKQIKRSLVLVVDYTPGEPLRVKLSRTAIDEDIAGMVDLTDDPQVSHSTHVVNKRIKHKAKATRLAIHFPNGGSLCKKTAAATFVEAVKLANPIKVRALGITCCKVPIVSTSKDIKSDRSQFKIGNSLYVMTYSSTSAKKKYLEIISKQLNLNWRIEIIN